jgi:hypothetical protein
MTTFEAGVHKDDRSAVSVNDDGAVLLIPIASIPKRELLAWENEQLRARLFRGLADAAEGKTGGSTGLLRTLTTSERATVRIELHRRDSAQSIARAVVEIATTRPSPVATLPTCLIESSCTA